MTVEPHAVYKHKSDVLCTNCLTNGRDRECDELRNVHELQLERSRHEQIARLESLKQTYESKLDSLRQQHSERLSHIQNQMSIAIHREQVTANNRVLSAIEQTSIKHAENVAALSKSHKAETVQLQNDLKTSRAREKDAVKRATSSASLDRAVQKKVEELQIQHKAWRSEKMEIARSADKDAKEKAAMKEEIDRSDFVKKALRNHMTLLSVLIYRITVILENYDETKTNLVAISNHRASVILELVTFQKSLSDELQRHKEQAKRLAKLLVTERKHQLDKEAQSRA